ncbi:MAG: lactate utilization protein C [Candidatus Methylacidiphilales bacterium]
MEQQVTPKEKILKKVRQALTFKSKNQFTNIDLDSNIYVQPSSDLSLLEVFAQQFTALSGEFVYCSNQFDFLDKLITLLEQRKWKHFFCWEHQLQDTLKDTGINFSHKKEQLEKVQAAITTCEALIARTGTILVSSTANSRTLTIWPPVHIVVAKRSQLVMETKDGMQLVKNRYGKNIPSLLSYITGPSRSNNIENTLVVGAHGPMEVFVFIVDDISRDR